MSGNDTLGTDRAMRDQGPLLSTDQEAELARIIIKQTMGAIKQPAADMLAKNISEIAGIYRSAGEHMNVVVSALSEQKINGFKPEILGKSIVPFLDHVLAQQDTSVPAEDEQQRQQHTQAKPLPRPPRQ